MIAAAFRDAVYPRQREVTLCAGAYGKNRAICDVVGGVSGVAFHRIFVLAMTYTESLRQIAVTLFFTWPLDRIAKVIPGKIMDARVFRRSQLP
jgi:hypothetical protein